MLDRKSFLVLEALYNLPEGLPRSEVNKLLNHTGKALNPHLQKLFAEKYVRFNGWLSNEQIIVITPEGCCVVESSHKIEAAEQKTFESETRAIEEKIVDKKTDARRWWITTFIAIAALIVAIFK